MHTTKQRLAVCDERPAGSRVMEAEMGLGTERQGGKDGEDSKLHFERNVWKVEWEVCGEQEKHWGHGFNEGGIYAFSKLGPNNNLCWRRL